MINLNKSELIQKDIIRTYKLAKLGVETHLSDTEIEILDYLIPLLSDLKIIECLCGRTYLPIQRFISNQDNVIFEIRLCKTLVYELLIEIKHFNKITCLKSDLQEIIIDVVESLYVKKINCVTFL